MPLFPSSPQTKPGCAWGGHVASQENSSPSLSCDWGGHMTRFWLTRCTWKMLNGDSEEHFKRGSGLLSFFFSLLGMQLQQWRWKPRSNVYEAMLSRKAEGTGFLQALCSYLAVLECPLRDLLLEKKTQSLVRISY